MIPTEYIFITQLIIGAILVTTAIRFRRFEKKTDRVIQSVTDYLTYITEEEERMEMQEVPKDRTDKNVTAGMEEHQSIKRSQQQAEQEKSNLIQAVLREYFP